MPHSAASDLVLYCLPMSHKSDARLRLNINCGDSPDLLVCVCMCVCIHVLVLLTFQTFNSFL